MWQWKDACSSSIKMEHRGAELNRPELYIDVSNSTSSWNHSYWRKRAASFHVSVIDDKDLYPTRGAVSSRCPPFCAIRKTLQSTARIFFESSLRLHHFQNYGLEISSTMIGQFIVRSSTFPQFRVTGLLPEPIIYQHNLSFVFILYYKCFLRFSSTS